MATHAHVSGRVKPVGYTDLYHIAKSHAHVLGRVEHIDLVSN
ncbi:hypothetical protein F383_27022 [Gossypium arboreum]|uniref:Uncharacterized protein n=1 Tax=Gossypium arboreum TaxID=29729 RepID=A0A0B0P9D0_GOSAR|nr:hypothetical protein F383_27022 [Gossypium arboreum]